MIPSLLQIPSAVSDSKLHSVLPNNGKGDFTFDRSTGATRINKDGLIEEVGYFSSELVQNGDFSELGSELVTNGDFATDSDWIKQGGWSIASGSANCNDSTGYRSISQSSLVSPIGKTYKVTYEVSDYVSGEVRCILGGFTLGQITSSNGLVTEYLTVSNASSNTFVYLETRGSGFTGSIDNVSVKQVDPNDRWSLGNGSGGTAWSITDKANYDNSATSGSFTNRIFQSGLDLKSGKKYKLTFDVTTTGSTDLWIGNSVGGVNYEGGTYRAFSTGYYCVLFDMPSEQTTLAFFANNNDVTLDNISLVEVQGDRPRLSYDITNGVVESQPHLLLEPSSTNLLTFSEDFSQSVWNKQNSTITSNYSVAADGTSNATRFLTTSNVASFLQVLSLSISNTTSYTVSVWAKSNNNNLNDFRFYTSTAGTSSVFTATTYWKRFEFNFTSTGTTSNIGLRGVSGKETDIQIFAFQLEQQSFATSYIKTAGTTITRAAETCNNSKPSVNSTEGVLYAEIAALADDLEYEILSVSDGSSNNRAYLQYTNVSNQIKFVYKVGGATQAGIGTATFDIVDFHKIACKWKANDFALWIDGNEVGTDTNGSVNSAGTFTQVNFDDGAGNTDFYGKVKGLAVYNEALSESQLMQLTGVTASSIYNNFVTRTASFTVEALNEVKKVIDNL